MESSRQLEDNIKDMSAYLEKLVLDVDDIGARRPVRPYFSKMYGRSRAPIAVLYNVLMRTQFDIDYSIWMPGSEMDIFDDFNQNGTIVEMDEVKVEDDIDDCVDNDDDEDDDDDDEEPEDEDNDDDGKEGLEEEEDESDDEEGEDIFSTASASDIEKTVLQRPTKSNSVNNNDFYRLIAAFAKLSVYIYMDHICDDDAFVSNFNINAQSCNAVQGCNTLLCKLSSALQKYHPVPVGYEYIYDQCADLLIELEHSIAKLEKFKHIILPQGLVGVNSLEFREVVESLTSVLNEVSFYSVRCRMGIQNIKCTMEKNKTLTQDTKVSQPNVGEDSDGNNANKRTGH